MSHREILMKKLAFKNSAGPVRLALKKSFKKNEITLYNFSGLKNKLI